MVSTFSSVVYFHRILRYRGPFRLSDYLNAWFQHLGSHRDAADQPSAADRDQDLVDILQFLQHLQRYRALPEHYIDIIERMDEDIAVLLFELPCLPACVIISVSVQNDLYAELLCGFHFDDRSSLRHNDRGFHAKHLGRIAYTLSMVAGGGGDHAPAFFFFAEFAYFVICPPDFERACDRKFSGLRKTSCHIHG